MIKYFAFMLFWLVYPHVYGQKNELQIKKTINNFLSAMHKGDTLLAKSTLAENCSLQTVLVNDSNSVYQIGSVQKFLNAIGSKPKNVNFEEKSPNLAIKIDGPLAIVWAKYKFYLNNKLHHFGTNVFTLVSIHNQWLITSIIDTRKNPKQ